MSFISAPVQAQNFGIVTFETPSHFDIEARNSLDSFSHLHYCFILQFIPFLGDSLLESFNLFLKLLDGQIIVSV